MNTGPDGPVAYRPRTPRATIKPPRHPSSIPPKNDQEAEKPWQKCNRPKAHRLRGGRTNPGVCRSKGQPQQRHSDQGADPTLEHSFNDKRPAYVGQRRPYKGHDFNFVFPCGCGQTDDAGDGERRGEAEKQDDTETERAQRANERIQPRQPPPIVANVCHPLQACQGCR
jgi:hypothetical protein